MTGRGQAMQLLYYIITVSSELQVQLESSTRFIEIHNTNCLTMIDVNRSCVNNTDLNEENSLAHLIEKLDPINEREVNPIQHSNYYSNEEFMGPHRQIDGKLSILKLNCQCINSKFDKIKLFLEGINNNAMPLSVITLQET